MYSQVDSEGCQYNLLDAIIDYVTDGSALVRKYVHVVTKRRIRRVRKTTVGWNFLINWKAGREQLILLKEQKKYSPIEVMRITPIHPK